MKAKISVVIRDNMGANYTIETTADCAKKAFNEWSDQDAPEQHITIVGLQGEVARWCCDDIQGIIVAEDLPTPQVLTPEKPGLVIPDSMKN